MEELGRKIGAISHRVTFRGSPFAVFNIGTVSAEHGRVPSGLIVSLHRVTPDPVSNKAWTDFPLILTWALGRVNSGWVVLKQFNAVRQVISLWRMGLPTAIPPCRLPTTNSFLGLRPEGAGGLGSRDRIRADIHLKLHDLMEKE